VSLFRGLVANGAGGVLRLQGAIGKAQGYPFQPAGPHQELRSVLWLKRPGQCGSRFAVTLR